MRIIVSGAAGFIGSHMCDRLLLEGHTVVGLDNLLTGSLENLAHLDSVTGFLFVEHDVNIPLTNQLPAGPVDAVASLASPDINCLSC